MKLKKNVKLVLAITVVALLLIGIGVIVPHITSSEKQTPTVIVESNIDLYGYQLKSNQTNLYKELFKQLEEVLDKEAVDETEYVTIITKLFIADFYQLSNKTTNMDIGGTQFVHTSIRDNFILNAENTMYQYIESNIYGDRKQELPEVKEFTNVEVSQIEYKYNDQLDKKAYQVKATWNYQKDLGYETEKTFIFVHEDHILSLVEMKDTE